MKHRHAGVIVSLCRTLELPGSGRGVAIPKLSQEGLGDVFEEEKTPEQEKREWWQLAAPHFCRKMVPKGIPKWTPNLTKMEDKSEHEVEVVFLLIWDEILEDF